MVTLYSSLFPSVLLLKGFAYTALPVQAWAGGSQLKEVFIEGHATNPLAFLKFCILVTEVGNCFVF